MVIKNAKLIAFIFLKAVKYESNSFSDLIFRMEARKVIGSD
jgi:predicted CopG family antitoxin